MKQYIIVVSLILLVSGLKCQTAFEIFTPSIGDTIPEYKFTDLRNHPKETLSLNELKGKWLILDFWSKDCAGCLQSFPKMNTLFEKYRDSLTILMVGTVGKYQLPSGKVIEREQSTKDVYSRLEKLYNLKFTVAFDSVLENSYSLRGLPYILIIDPQGYVRGITTSVNEKIISSFLSGNEPKLQRAYTGSEKELLENNYDRGLSETLGTDNNKEIKVDKEVLKSELSLYNKETMRSNYFPGFYDVNSKRVKDILNTGVLEVSNLSLKNLFYFAFWGVADWGSDHPKFYFDYSKDFIFETKDTFKFDKSNLDKYAYNLTLPSNRIDIETFKRIMQKDIEVYFGFKGRVEKRSMPVYYLVIADGEKAKKLKTEGRPDRYHYIEDLTQSRFQMILNDSPVATLCRWIGGYTSLQYPVIDGTGFKNNIDIDLQTYIYDLKEVEKSLEKYGLKLESGYKEMETIVIGDSTKF